MKLLAQLNLIDLIQTVRLQNSENTEKFNIKNRHDWHLLEWHLFIDWDMGLLFGNDVNISYLHEDSYLWFFSHCLYFLLFRI